VERGKGVYERRCAGCHGVRGDGNGPVATFLDPRPRDFTLGSFKFRTTPSGALPTDGDLYRTLTRGVRFTAMPTWHEVHEKDRIAVIAYVKTLSPRWKDDKPEPAVAIGDPPKATPELLARGKALYAQAKCSQCHGDGGKGDGPSAGELRDDLKFPIRPTDFTRGQFKAGGDVRDVYRTMTTGLDGTPMPSFADSMSDDERWAISYYVLSFSAFNDPLTGTGLNLDPGTRTRLNAPERGKFANPRLALDPSAPPEIAEGPKALVRFHKGMLGEGR
jgi:cytochrome c oxidase cbb3-type subunit 2